MVWVDRGDIIKSNNKSKIKKEASKRSSMIDRHNPSWPHTSLYVDSTKVIQRKEGITHVLSMRVSNFTTILGIWILYPASWNYDTQITITAQNDLWLSVAAISRMKMPLPIKWMTIIQPHQNTKLTRLLRVIHLSSSTGLRKENIFSRS